MTLDLDAVRRQFPALATGEVYLDNPGGTQVPRSVAQAMSDYLLHHNANCGGAFRTSRETDAALGTARVAAADFFGGKPEEIVFGNNMTTLTFHLSRSLAERIAPGDEIIVTRLDHDANVAPWLRLAEDTGANVHFLDFRPEDCTLDLEQLDQLLSRRTKIVAVGYASNAVGTINPVAEIAARARAVGALSFVDAVQFAPHALLDVAALGCDFVAASAYKFFGPHVGVLWGRHELLESLRAYKVRPAHDEAPEKFETGTQNHEGIVGTTAAIDYLASLGAGDRRRERLASAMAALREHENTLCERLLTVLSDLPGVQVHGITDRTRMAERVPTVSFTWPGRAPRAIAESLARRGIFVWDGSYYAVEVVARLGFADSGGMVRVGMAHYNTAEEIDRLAEALASA